ncbi:nucleoside triphosphate pyrophosphohydrolase [Alicyclobacillus herbarius]|uniref:nucleoside triphosphate pyrophosphohydrolase n=1 Tax=Alicyclobacillus herbarius TaxID=122960 RepID=UPI00041D296A|nr:nucleoside triphosphate pyrophosphohydrolase [Alicyclobacillus herbarius]
MATIYVIGLGPGDVSGLPLGAWQRLKSGLPIVLRTRFHPVVPMLDKEGLVYQTFDEVYDTGESFPEVYREMAQRLRQLAQAAGDIVYAVPGHPLMAEQSVQELLALDADAEIHVQIEAGHSFLDPVCTALGVDPIDGLCLLDGTLLCQEQIRPDLHLLIAQVFSRAVASEVKLTLMEVYPDEYEVTVVRAAGVTGEERIVRVPLYELDRLDFIDHLTSVFVPRAEAEPARRRDPWHVAGLVRRLREPGGCPWDLQQTHDSLRPYVIEEAYEVAHAIDEGDPYALMEELGDLYLQILLHAQIASEVGDFSLRDVYQTLADKLVRRHPHVFGEDKASSAAEAEAAWRKAKAAEGKSLAKTKDAGGTEERTQTWLLDDVRMGQPAHTIARIYQERAAKVGFDWPSVNEVYAKLREEVDELGQELGGECPPKGADRRRALSELGDVLFVIVNLARWLDLDVEEALAAANRKFYRRFQHVERRARERGGWTKHTLADLDAFWDEAKRQESGSKRASRASAES